MQYVKIIADGMYIIKQAPEKLKFIKNNKEAPVELTKLDKVRVKVVYDARMAGGYVSKIITKDGYICTISGNILDNNHKLGIISDPA